MLSHKIVEEVSPRSGRKNVAHGVSRGSARPPSPPSPLPLGRERGAEGRVRALRPRACALGYDLPPVTGLQKGRPHEEDFFSELPTQDTSRFLKNLPMPVIPAKSSPCACRRAGTPSFYVLPPLGDGARVSTVSPLPLGERGRGVRGPIRHPE